jgi:hypothetical protein
VQATKWNFSARRIDGNISGSLAGYSGGMTMAYLDLSPAISALRERPEEFELVRDDHLHHVPSRHMFSFENDGTVRVIAHCNCAMLWTRPEHDKLFREAFHEWHMSYWINREFASHFLPPAGWRRLCMRLLSFLLTHPRLASQRHALPQHSMS